MNAVPRLSIGLPVYNGEKYLAESIDALLGQTYEDFELIISDNASTDDTADICHRYGKQDSRIRYFRQPHNIGIAPNHNFAFQQSRGEMFKWASADDLYGRDLLQRCVGALDEYPDVVLAHSWTAAIDSADNVTQALEYPLATDSPRAPERFRSILFGSSGLFGTDSSHIISAGNEGVIRADDSYGVIRADVLRQVARMESYWHGDQVCFVELTLHGRFYQVPDWLYFRRDHSDRATRAGTTVRARCANLDPRRAGRLHPTARLFAECIWGYLAAVHRAPLSPTDRQECYRLLMQWMANRTVTKALPRRTAADQPPPPVHNPTVSVSAVVAGQGRR